MGTKHTATVVIATRNRSNDLLRAVESALKQSHRPLEVLVFDDASTDGTSDKLSHEFPDVRLFRNTDRVGYIALRNRGFQKASGEFVFSLDDDAFFTCNRTIERSIVLFERFPKVAAIALPYFEPRTTDPERLMLRVPSLSNVRSFVGCAHALRKSVVSQLGGYREFFYHQGEERDLAIRLQELGYSILYGDSEPIVHTYSLDREIDVMSYYGVRNTLLFDILNVPLPYVIPRFVVDAFNLFCHKLEWRSAPTRARYVISSMITCARYWAMRNPVRRETYRSYRALPTHGPLPLELGAKSNNSMMKIPTTENSVIS
jgi:GT2 family glycosyltransferase